MKEIASSQERIETDKDIVFIYALIDPLLTDIRYVGKTTDLSYRFSRHIKYELKFDTHKSRWIKSLLKRGELPILSILEETNSLEWEIKERYWIKKLKSEGFALTNETHGGDGLKKGFKHKPESVQKIIASLKKRDPEIRKIAALKTSLKLKNKLLSEEHRKKLSEAHKKIWQALSQNSRKIFLQNLKHEWTEQSRLKMSLTRRGEKRGNGTSKYLGVSWFKRDSNWRAWLKYNGKQIHLGYFDNDINAAKAYDQAARKYFGDFAKTNF